MLESMQQGKILKGVKKIAVVRANGLGDYIASIPAMNALRLAYPKAEIVLIGKPWQKGFLEGRPGAVDRVVVAPVSKGVRLEKDQEENPTELKKFFREMKKEKFDLAIQMHGGGRNSNPFTKNLGAKTTLGLRTPDAIKLDLWVPFIYHQNEVFRYLELVSTIGASTSDILPRVAVMKKDLLEVAKTFPELRYPFVVIHPGASDVRRRWPAKRFAQVADILSKRGFQIVIIGTGDEKQHIDEITYFMKSAPLIAYNVLSVGGLAGLLSMANIVIANDSGPMHLADSVGTPTVGIIWGGNCVNWVHLNRTTFRFVPSWITNCPKCDANMMTDTVPDNGCTHEACFVEKVEVQDVLNTVEQLLIDTQEIAQNGDLHNRLRQPRKLYV
jgi:ADP-heptose:LPS heptosyltransferase